MENVPNNEIEQRIRFLQAALAQMRLDGAFIWQNVDRFYFSGTIQSSILFVPCEGKSLLMVQKGYSRARDESPLQMIPLKGRGAIKDILYDLGFRKLETIGLEMDVLPASHYVWFRDKFMGCQCKDISGVIRRIRMIKSRYEIDQITKATRILHKGFSEIQKIIRVGMTELEIDGHLALIARREGHMGVLRMRGWNQEMTYAHVLSGDSGSVTSFLDSPHGGQGTTPAMAQGAGFRKVRRNEPIGIDYSVGVNGYLGDQFRTVVIGDLSRVFREALKCSKDILLLLAEKAKPGVHCKDLYHLAVEEATRQGFSDYFMGHGDGKVGYIGHGLGLEIDEYPIISSRFDERLEEGMIVALEPKFTFPGRGIVGLEDDYVVTQSGLKRLTITDQVLIHCDGE
jgi:Xaa-Pro aminopeptidase